MKYITASVFLLASAIRAFAEPTSKAELMRELVHVYGMDQMIADAKKAGETQAHDAVEQMFAQAKSSIPALSPDVLQKIQVAADKMMTEIQKSWIVEDALLIWETDFAADLSPEELTKIVEVCKTPMGQKQIAASKRANGAIQKYILDRNKTVVEKAMREYVSDLQKIIADQAK